MDSDCILFQKIDWFYQQLERYDFIAYVMNIDGDLESLNNDMMASNRDGVVISEYFNRIRRKVEMGEVTYRAALGSKIEKEACHEAFSRGASVLRLDKEFVHPIFSRKSDLPIYKIERDDEEHEHHFSKKSFCYLLTKDAMGDFRYASREEIVKSKSFTGYLFRKALN